MLPFRAVAPAATLSISLIAGMAQAETSAPLLGGALRDLPDGGERMLHEWSGSSAPALLIHTTDDTLAKARGFVPIVPGIAVGHPPQDEWSALRSGAKIQKLFIPPQRTLLLDRAGDTVALGPARNESGLRGEGTIVGVVDTGGDVFHRALQDDNGKTRVAWFLAFERQPLGLHPVLEEEYGCLGSDPCAIWSREDIDAALELGRRGELPDDPIGHGTHIASLAAGNDESYPGIAPLADLVLVAAAGPEGGVNDARILLGTKFVFDRASDADLPAVVNVSLGSSFGAHDGTSTVERGLAELAHGEGRAVVLAAGNSGTVYRSVSSAYPKPFGVHTEVAVLPSSVVRIPLLTPDHPSGTQTGSVFVWISTRPGDSISVGFSNGRGHETAFLSPGDARGISSDSLDDADDYDVVLLNGTDENLDTDVLPGSAVVAIVGAWEAGRVFELILEGEGNARMWVTGTGTLSPNISQFGPLFPRARRAGTVAVPASHPALITVGATINRNEWEDFSGETVGYGGWQEGRAGFSAAGPNQNRTMKPELVAPGSGVIGAMARSADPRMSASPSQFSSYGSCPDEVECYVIDDEHGIASGTSMAAPLVAGAVALLMQRDGSVTMERAKRYLMAGAHQVPNQRRPTLVGTGELDLVGALVAQERDLAENGREGDIGPNAATSRVAWADDFLYPKAGPALQGYLLVRDEEGRPVDVEDEAVEISTRGPARTTFERLAPGLVLLEVTGEEDATSETVTVRCSLEGRLVSEDTFVIERDPNLAKHGYELSGGTCGWQAGTGRNAWSLLMLMVLGGLVLRRPRARHRWKADNHEPRGARDPDRMDG